MALCSALAGQGPLRVQQLLANYKAVLICPALFTSKQQTVKQNNKEELKANLKRFSAPEKWIVSGDWQLEHKANKM